MPRGPRFGKAWIEACAWVYATYQTCWICKRPVDMQLPYRDPDGNVNKWCKSVDHVIPLAHGGSLLDHANLRLAHFRCNSSRGARGSAQAEPSRHW